ncbi:Os01g0579600 [Oryza sativa Japonica Group]|jgi:hypothetical protein|uniref:Os01g0579600 protein n=1 Tax=Oryza sativa subsp. japonica TaxID=39947 RepID=A0A0N7KD77_ORYSJ|nr:hypothetical protein EE612_003684 [Oryza sativa]BAS72849.1 Os01g0579600 [Oryza sativa Japonica Group]
MESGYGFRFSDDDVVGRWLSYLFVAGRRRRCRFLELCLIGFWILDLQESASSLTVGERLCAAFLPFVAIAEAVFFALTDCLADLLPPSAAASRHRRSAASSYLAAVARKWNHQQRGRVGIGCTSLTLRQLARLADESRCCNL